MAGQGRPQNCQPTDAHTIAVDQHDPMILALRQFDQATLLPCETPTIQILYWLASRFLAMMSALNILEAGTRNKSQSLASAETFHWVASRFPTT